MDGTNVTKSLRPTHRSKTLFAIKSTRAVKRITFDKSEASPGETLYVHVPKLNENEVLVPGSLALRFNIDLFWRPREQLSRAERVAGPCQKDGGKIRGHNFARHGRLRPVQNL